jgi:hypothetical protein
MKANRFQATPILPGRVCRSRAPGGLSLALIALAATLAGPRNAGAQIQSLSFSGGVLLNTRVNFNHLGSGQIPVPPAEPPMEPPDDPPADPETTGLFGRDPRVLRSLHGPGSIPTERSIEDAADFVLPSANLEYRGSLGTAGASDWGLLLGVGYQSVSAEASGSWADPGPGLFQSGTPRMASLSGDPQAAPRFNLVNGHWELGADLFPVTGGLYFESQIAGRLNGIISAGMLAIMVNADLKFRELGTDEAGNEVIVRGDEGTNDVIFGGFVQLGLDWALWEKASLVASARWQPTEIFDHSVSGREAEIDFTEAFAVHAGFSFRF